MTRGRLSLVALAATFLLFGSFANGQSPQSKKSRPNAANPRVKNVADGKNRKTGKPDPYEDPAYRQYGIYEATAPHPTTAEPRVTTLPLNLKPGERIALVGNTLFDRAQLFGYFEAMLHQRHPDHKLVVRNLAWSADTTELQPRPENFADQDQHLVHERADVIFAAYGFNESFAGPDGLDVFRQSLSDYLDSLQRKSFNEETGPLVVLVSPIANEDTAAVDAGTRNNANIALYVEAMKEVAAENDVAFVDVFTPTLAAMNDAATDLTINGCHLNDTGYQLFAKELFEQTFDVSASPVSEKLRRNIVDKNRQYFRRYRPLNTFYYTGGRKKDYGYLDFLPAMKNFDIMVSNRDQRSWAIAAGQDVPEDVDDSNLPPLPETKESRGANNWMTAVDERKAFEVDPRFDVTLFAGEEEFPDIAAPIQMRWDTRGRLWISTSTTYPHVYPGNEPDDKLVILEDTDGDGKADKSTVFADDLHIPLSFEFGDGGVYVSEEPHLTFLKDTDGDDRADVRTEVLTGFGTEDSHHALHDFVWSPDGDLIIRESIFHHSQIETPYGPVRQRNSGWFRFDTRSHLLTSFGSYHSTNPWGVTFDEWGQHMASHPIYAAAFHSRDPDYPDQHPKPTGLQAYSGTCGQAFVDFNTFPSELSGHFIKARYKPTNRIEIHKWKEGPFGFDEQYVSDLVFSTNLSFIPVDLNFGPRGALYVCDWYNPIKGHAQYSLRDERRDRHSGRIWRVTAKDRPLQAMPEINGASTEALLEILKRPEYRLRYLAKLELRERPQDEVVAALDRWVAELDKASPRYRHHQLEALWLYRTVGAHGRQLEETIFDGPEPLAISLLKDVLGCDNHMARAAAVEQLRYWHYEVPDAIELLTAAANDTNGIVRMQAAIAATYFGTPAALEAALQTLNHPAEKHVAYAIQCALGSSTLKRHWENDPSFKVRAVLARLKRSSTLKEPNPSAKEKQFDLQEDLKTVRISCKPERMLFTVDQFAVTTGQPVKIVFTNPDATDHNLVIVEPGALADVGMAANAMARDPKFANSNFIPQSQRDRILHYAPMIGPSRKSQVHVMRFNAPTEPGIYPFVCTFPGHWVIMNGEMVVAKNLSEVEAMLAARKPRIVNEWTVADFDDIDLDTLAKATSEETAMRGMQALVKANCNQCHQVAGHGINLGPDLTEVGKRFQGKKLLEQILNPSAAIDKKYQIQQFVLEDGRLVSGVVKEENERVVKVMTNLLTPDVVTTIKRNQVLEQIASTVSAMPNGLANTLTKQEIVDLVCSLQSGGYKLPEHLMHHHHHHSPEEK